jgi:hypothetical protein
MEGLAVKKKLRAGKASCNGWGRCFIIGDAGVRIFKKKKR